jgi:hypothetical protein
MPETQDTGMFMLFNESTGRPAGQEDPTTFFEAPPPPPDGGLLPPDGTMPPPDGTMPPPDGTMPPPDGTIPPPDDTPPPPPDDTVPPPDVDVPPAQDIGEPPDPTAGTDPTSGDVPPPDGTVPPPDGAVPPPTGGSMPPPNLIMVSIDNIVGLPIGRETFTHVFGTEVPNPRYNPDGDPYFDDINGNGAQDADEPTTPFRPALFKADDWRSTDIRMYYRRADTNAAVTFEDVAFDARTPQTQDGAALVPRNLLPRLNAYRFGRPNSALNLLTTFLPPEFFDGMHALDASTQFDVFGAVAVINLMMDQSQNVHAIVDIDGPGPLTSQNTLIDAHIFVPPVGDPFVLLLKGFANRSGGVLPMNPGPPDPGVAQ